MLPLLSCMAVLSKAEVTTLESLTSTCATAVPQIGPLVDNTNYGQLLRTLLYRQSH